MTKNEEIVLNNLLNRISKESYQNLEEMTNKSVNEFNEEQIGLLLSIFNSEINTGKLAMRNFIDDILKNVDYLTEAETDYALMELEIDNYNIKELETFLETQVNLLKQPTENNSKQRTKSKYKKNLYKSNI